MPVLISLAAVTGNEAALTLEDTYKVSPGQAIEANIQALWDDSVKLADDGWREDRWGVSNRNPLDDDFKVNLRTGAIDFAVDWYLDPLVIVSKDRRQRLHALVRPSVSPFLACRVASRTA